MASPTASKVRLKTIGTEVALILSPDVLSKLGIKGGDLLSMEATPTGIHLTPDVATDTLAVARRVMDEDKELLRRLAE